MDEAPGTSANGAAKLPQLPEGLAELIARKQWVCWRFEEREGKTTKVPYQPNDKPASTTKRGTWSTYADCVAAMAAGGFDGIGYVFARGYIAIDLDDVIDAQGQVVDWALALVRLLRTYTEVSPSGTGLHLIARCDDTLEKGFKRAKSGGASIEGYSEGRYFCMTGRVFTHQTVKCATDEIAHVDLQTVLDHPLFAGVSESAPTAARNGDAPVSIEDDLDVVIDTSRHIDAGVLMVALDNLPDLRARWMKREPPSRDGSHSGYMLSLAWRFLDIGWSDQQVADALVSFCRQHSRLDKAERRQICRAINRARKSHEADKKPLTPKAADDAMKDEAEDERFEAIKDDRAEALAELSAHFGAEVVDMKRMGQYPGRTMLKVGSTWLDIGTPEAWMQQTSVLTALCHHRIAVVPRVKPPVWARIAALIMRHQRDDEEVGDEEEVTRIDDWLAGLDLREVDDAKVVGLRTTRDAHIHNGEAFVFVGVDGLDQKSLALSRSIYTVLREAGFRSRIVKAKGSTSRNAWCRAIPRL